MSKKYIYYWAPFISQVATARAVLNSAVSVSKFGKKNNIFPVIIDAFGEWEKYYDEISEEKIEILKLTNTKSFLSFRKEGFFRSRFSYFYIFIRCFIPLYKVLKKNRPDVIIVHLITPLPFILFLLFTFKTKLIVRISGYPHFNFLRKILWKLVLKKIFFITSPTSATLDLMKNNFKINNVKVLRDPILYIKRIFSFEKREQQYFKFYNNENYILTIGRLTKQKNFIFLINAFKKISEKYKNLNLIIIGDGEDKYKISRVIIINNLKNRVKIIQNTDNVFFYIRRSLCLVSASLWEDPGFVLIESMFANKIVISSDCPNGPREVLDFGHAGYLFKSNSEKDFLRTFDKFYEDNDDIIKKKLINAKKISKAYSLFSHFKSLNQILLNKL